MNGWQLAVFAYGALWALAGAALVARHWWERRRERRGEELFDRVFAEQAGIDLSYTCEPRFLKGGRR